MSGEYTAPKESPFFGFEAHLHQLQTTITQIWHKIKFRDEQMPHNEVVRGTKHEIQPLCSDASARANQTRLCFTYRSRFEPILREEYGPSPLSFLGSLLFNPIPNTTVAGVLDNQHFTTDVGWGCMIRTSQTLLANALQSIYLGHEYHYDGTDLKLGKIVALFADVYQAPFSLHNFIRVASESPLQVKPGEWFGPNAASLSIQRLCEHYAHNTEAKIQVFISESCNLYDTDFDTHFAKGGPPILVLFPIRLGIEHVNVFYHSSLFQLLSTKYSVGIAGGKPSSSYYIFGYLGSELLYVDPHHLQETSGDISTYYTSKCRSLSISALDPSMLIGLALSNIKDYHDLRALLTNNKIIHFHKGLKPQKFSADETYAKFTIPELDGESVDDFVNVSDQVSDTKFGDEEEFTAAENLPEFFV